jgi:hypothetical protein
MENRRYYCHRLFEEFLKQKITGKNVFILKKQTYHDYRLIALTFLTFGAK